MKNQQDQNDGKGPDDEQDPGKNRKDAKLSPPPVFSLIFWVLVLGCIPLVVLFVQNREEIKTLAASEFREALLEQRIEKVEIRTQSGTAVVTIVGEFRPADAKSPPQKFKAKLVYTEGLAREIDQNMPPGKEVKIVPVSNFLSHLLLSLVPVILIFLLLYFLFTRHLRNAGKGALQFGKSRARVAQNLEKVTFQDVAGIDSAKEEVVEIIEYLKDPGRFHKLGGRIPHGVLMVGPPGTGKTLLARAIAGEADVPFFNISGSDFVEMFVGVGASRVRDMFEQAKRSAPCIVFIDEIDAVGRSRFSGIGGGHDEREQTLNALLVEMDGFEVNSGVIVIAATNRPDVLDNALLRPGRFDRQVHVELPDLVGRREIMDVHIKNIKMRKDVDLDVLARSTPGFSGADLANLLNEAALAAASHNKDAVDIGDFEEARDKVMFGKERPWRAMSDKDRKMTALHEAGHALASIYCTHTDPLHKVSIIPRGKTLGGALYFPEGDKVSQSSQELFERMVITVAGRCAENLVLKEINSGAYADIHQCSQIARTMVTKLGMSDKLGFIEYSVTDENLGYLGQLSRPEYSEETARSIDREVRRLVDEAMERCVQILGEHRDQLDLLGNALLEKETLSAREVYELLGLPMPERLQLKKEKKTQTEAKEPLPEVAANPEPGAEDPLANPPTGLEPKPEN